MQVKLSIQEKLKDLRVERRLTLEQLSEQVGISSSALGKYESNDLKDISAYSIEKLASFYGVSTDYLIGLTDNKKHPGSELSALHLDDAAIDVLKSGTFNHRLLSELISHKDFQRFMLDAEIYVDRIADLRIKDMNTVLEAVRQSTLANYTSGQEDLYTRTMELAQIKEEEYFGHVVTEDLTGILQDIREDHKSDSTTADDSDTSSIEIIQNQLQDAMNFEGSDSEKKTKAFLTAFGIDYDSITMDEFVTLMGVLNKSKHMKSPINQRGKAPFYPPHGKGKRKHRK
ncbi:MAG: helix-turn-helix transcriptional regulator [Eubacteriales bacterium]|nr:helix-turn-helix transcriptional regulator [Eubacteriales bacterium]